MTFRPPLPPPVIPRWQRVALFVLLVVLVTGTLVSGLLLAAALS